MNRYPVAKRYSRVLLNTVELSDVPRVLEELRKFLKLIEENRKLKLLFAGQIFSEEEKDRALGQLLPYMKFSSRTERLLRLIIIRGHLSALKEIIKVSTELYNERLGKATALVTTAIQLDEDHTRKLREALKQLIHKDVEIETWLDPSLLGGFIVRVGSTVYDSSLKGQFRLLRAELTK